MKLDSSIQLVEPHLPSLLVSPESLVRIKGAAKLLPRFAVNFFGFETRLGEGAGPTDCALDLTAEGARLLAGRHPTSLPQALHEGPWQRVQRFYQEWGDTREPAYSDAGCTWLEFDTSRSEPSPNLLFGYWPEDTSARRPLPWLVEAILPLLLGAPLSADLRRGLLHCFEARPPGTNDFQVGAMIARGIQAVRLCVFDIPPAALPAYLERIGWRGPMEEVQRLTEAFSPHADFIALHLDVGEQLYPHLGLEPGFTAGPWARQPHLEPRWHRQFDQLLQLGLCTPARRDALLSWIGYQRCPPEQDQPQGPVLLRGLSHLKLHLRPATPTIAKAYFGIAHRTPGAHTNAA